MINHNFQWLEGLVIHLFTLSNLWIVHLFTSVVPTCDNVPLFESSNCKALNYTQLKFRKGDSNDGFKLHQYQSHIGSRCSSCCRNCAWRNAASWWRLLGKIHINILLNSYVMSSLNGTLERLELGFSFLLHSTVVLDTMVAVVAVVDIAVGMTRIPAWNKFTFTQTIKISILV